MKNYSNQPVVIGATGGSGTRIFTKICMDAGYFMGSNLNDSLDSLEFSDFYERWINTSFLIDELALPQEQIRQRDRELQKCIRAHRSTMTDPYGMWGWKGPRSMFLLDLIHKHYREMKFIHVIRDGRDMAYSSNQNQLMKHGHALLDKKWDNLSSACRSILLWSLCNMRVSRYGEEVMGNRYLRIRFEDLCLAPKATLNLILNFLSVCYTDESTLIEQIKKPKSIGRWRMESEDELLQVVKWGRPGLEHFGYT